MATTETLLASQVGARRPEGSFDLSAVAITAALTISAVAIHGYHPYAEDGGIYLPGVLKLVHPALYPTWTGFVTAQTRFSLFGFAVAEFARVSGVGVMALMFSVYVLSIWATLYAAWLLIVRCCNDRAASFAGVTMLALVLTIPIAGTSLMLMDPYVTARSISTPCGLLAIVGAMDVLSQLRDAAGVRMTSIGLSGVSLLIAALMHPLMAAYAAGCILLLACSSIGNGRVRFAAFGGVALISILFAGLLEVFSPAQPAAYKAVAVTRYYWFLSNWHWYEVAGLIAPLLLLAGMIRSHTVLNTYARWLAEMAIAGGVIGLAVSVLFARESAHSYMVAMLQPLRIFQMVYVVMILFAGALLGKIVLKKSSLRWMGTLLGLGGLMFLVQAETFPNSDHLELPGTNARNDWERGFVWIRENTPIDAAFALDANYITSGGEDAQNFRAIAERSALPDYAKDGGIAAIEPDLTAAWAAGEKLQAGLANMRDEQRRQRLVSAGVRWLVLPVGSSTSFPCPYENRAMKVCHIPNQ